MRALTVLIPDNPEEIAVQGTASLETFMRDDWLAGYVGKTKTVLLLVAVAGGDRALTPQEHEDIRTLAIDLLMTSVRNAV